MSRLAYVPFERDPGARARVQETLQGVGFSPALFFSAEGTQAFLTDDPHGAISVLAFRGTEFRGIEVEPRDRTTDLHWWLTAWTQGGRVHGGFAKGLEAVWTDLAPRLAQTSGRRLYTGHSLGAALATLAASREPPHALYTYGSPRVGDDTFLRTVSPLELHRYTNCCDIICRLPPEAFGYRHLGPASYLDQEGAVHVAPVRADMKGDQCRARLTYLRRWAWRRGTLWTRDFADHAPVNYVSALSQVP